MKYRIITNGNKFRVQRRVFYFFWTIYLYGVNEGGGQYFIEYDSIDECWTKLKETIPSKNRWMVVDGATAFSAP